MAFVLAWVAVGLSAVWSPGPAAALRSPPAAAPADGGGPRPRTIAEALRTPGDLLVVDCGPGSPHAALADKMAADLRPLRDGAPRRAAAADLEPEDWRDTHLLVLADGADDPLVMAVSRGLDLRIEPSRLSLAGLDRRGEVAALIVLPHPRADDRWVMLLVGTSPAALRRLDRWIRNDVAAPLMLVDDDGVHLAETARDGAGRWRVAAGHPYDADEVRAEAAAWVAESGCSVASWEGDVAVDEAARELLVDVTVALECPGRPRGSGDAWLTLNPRAAIEICEGPGVRGCQRHDARDGRLLLRVASRRRPPRIHLRYRLRLDGRLRAWYVGPGGGYLMPEANGFPRVRGAADEPCQERAPYRLEVRTGADDVLVAGAGERSESGGLPVEGVGTPVLVWGRWHLVPGAGGDRLYLPAGAPPEVAARGRSLLDALRRQLPGCGPLLLAAAPRPEAWYGDGTLVAPPELLEPRPVDDVDRWLLQRLRAQHLIRLGERRGRPVSVSGRAVSLSEPVTVRLWRLRGRWWQELDEGPVAADGSFQLHGSGGGSLLVTAEAPGQVPVAAAVSGDGEERDLVLALTPLRDVSLECLRCGDDLGAASFPMRLVEPGHYRATVDLDEARRAYGSFPYAFLLEPAHGGITRVLDPRGPPDQFPSFLTPEELHADQVEVDLWVEQLRFWIELPGALLAPAAWIEIPPAAP